MKLFTLMTVQMGALNLSPGTYLAQVTLPINSIVRGICISKGVASLSIETTEDMSMTEVKRFFVVLYESDAAWLHVINTNMLNDETASLKYVMSGSLVHDNSIITDRPIRTEMLGNEVILRVSPNHGIHTHNITTYNYLLYEVVHLNPTVSNELDL